MNVLRQALVPLLAAIGALGSCGEGGMPESAAAASSVAAARLAAQEAPEFPPAPVYVSPIGADGDSVSVLDFEVLAVSLAPSATDTLVGTSGVPLAPGALREGQLRRVRLYLEGVEQPIAVSALAGRHADGSLRSILVRFPLAPSAKLGPAAGRITLTDDRPTSRDWAIEGEPVGASAALPQAVVLPSDPDYLVRTDLVGPTVPSSRALASGGEFARYERDFARYADRHWDRKGDAWTENYYDRALVYYAFWVRTGKPDYWLRATRLAVNYRRDYLEKNAHKSSPHWAQLEGLEKHYLLTGDERSREAVGRVADMFHRIFQQRGYLGPGTKGSENRIQARVLEAQLLAYRLGAPAGSSTQVAWGARMEDALDLILASQSEDGAFRFDRTCGESLNYMSAMLNDALIGYHSYYSADPRILPAVRRSVDWLVETQWLADRSAFRYISGPCEGVGSGGPAADLNLMYVAGIAWVYNQTGDARYRAAADRAFEGGVGRGNLNGSKQFNENYYSSFNYLGWR